MTELENLKAHVAVLDVLKHNFECLSKSERYSDAYIQNLEDQNESFKHIIELIELQARIRKLS
jgi:hypothetical protein